MLGTRAVANRLHRWIFNRLLWSRRSTMAEYYKIDGRKLTLREYCNIARSWKGLVAWIAARLGTPLPLGTAFRQPSSVRELQVTENEFSPQAKAKLQSL